MPMLRMGESTSSTGAYYPGDGSGTTFWGGPGSGTDAPNPRDISNVLYDDHERPRWSRRNLSNMVWQWGQFLDHDITLTETSSLPGDFAPIEVGAGDPMMPMIPFSRSEAAAGTGTDVMNPRQQLNGISSYIDASNVYGSDAVRATALRDIGNGGRLKTSAGNLLPFNTAGLPNAGGTGADLFLAGDIRANEQVGLTAMHTLFMREHNRLAGMLADNNPTWSDEELYQTSRKIVGAEMQAITYNEFLPSLLGRRNTRSLAADEYDYDQTVDATIGNEFATSIYRFGHSMLPEELPLARFGQEQAGSLPLADAFFDSTFIASDGTNGTHHIEQLLMGFSRNKALEIGPQLTSAVRNFLFGAPGSGGMDLAALNIQRGRDHGLPSYNETRRACGLSPANSFRDITRDRKVRRRLKQLYDSVDEIDAWVGALAEDHVRGSSVGELTLNAMVDEFTKLRDGDRFFYTGDIELMDNEAIDAVIDLSSWSLSDILVENTALEHAPEDVFRVGWGGGGLFGGIEDLFGRIGDLLDCFGDRRIDGVRGWFEMPPHLPNEGVAGVPEPGTASLLVAGALLCLLRRRMF